MVVTAYADAAEELDPKRFGAECVLKQPIDDDVLRAAVEHCLATETDEADR